MYRDPTSYRPSRSPSAPGWIAGGNDDTVRNNRFYDNWRRGAMLFAVPDAVVCTPPAHQAGCDPAKVSTSFDNRFYGNVMGVAPDGSVQPNGLDFWWDSFTGNTGNCWYQNQAAPGRQITTSPNNLPDCNNGQDPSLSVGVTDVANEEELLSCFLAFTEGDFDPNGPCPWFTTPPKPG